jgi:hypothetical protein
MKGASGGKVAGMRKSVMLHLIREFSASSLMRSRKPLWQTTARWHEMLGLLELLGIEGDTRCGII